MHKLTITEQKVIGSTHTGMIEVRVGPFQPLRHQCGHQKEWILSLMRTVDKNIMMMKMVFSMTSLDLGKTNF